MHIIEALYITAALIALSAGVPQLRQLLIAKASDELSLPTWCTWLFTQCATLIYVTALGNILMIVVNFAWVGFYGAMVCLIIFYRRRGSLINEPVLVEDKQ